MVNVFQGDLDLVTYSLYSKARFLGVDTETGGLDRVGDDMYLVQLCDERGNASIIQVVRDQPAPYLKQLLENPSKVIIMHNAFFDVPFLARTYGIVFKNVVCTLMGARIAEISSESYSLKALLKYFFNVRMDKTLQKQSWADTEGRKLTQEEIEYASGDTQHLVPLYDKIAEVLVQKGQMKFAQEVFDTIPAYSKLILAGKHSMFDIGDFGAARGRKKKTV